MLKHLRSRQLLAASVAILLLWNAGPVAGRQGAATFAARVAELSEPGGYFDTDNLISNERSYLHVIPALESAGLKGGAYIGVGPDQNFSYIAQVRPAIAFILDIRRDNLLLHLLFKALFELAPTRVEYLGLLHGRPAPPNAGELKDAPIDRLAAYIDGARADARSTDALRQRVDAAIKRYGVALSKQDVETIDRFHRTFIDNGLSLKFQSTGRAPRTYYPTYRDLLLETDRQGKRRSFMASEADYEFVRSLQTRDLVIPVVGNLSGKAALANIARLMEQRGDKLSVFYASNVEFYLFSDGSFPRFVTNLARLPHSGNSLIVRSIFGGYALPDSVPGYYSTSQVQSIDRLIEGNSNGHTQDYREIVGGR